MFVGTHFSELPELEFNIPGSTSVLSIDLCLFSDGIDVSDEPELALVVYPYSIQDSVVLIYQYAT